MPTQPKTISPALALAASETIESIREQVATLARADARFNPKSDQDNDEGAGFIGGGSMYVCDLIAPTAEGEAWKAVIQSTDSKLREVSFTLQNGTVALGADVREVQRTTDYKPVPVPPAAPATEPAAEEAAQPSTHAASQPPLEARLATEIPSRLDRFMVMPAGVHTVTLGRGGKPVKVTVEVNEATADALNAQMAAIQAHHPRLAPYFDFAHEHRKASAHPTRFFWSPTAPDGSTDPGVYAETDGGTRSGLEAVESGEYAGFSMVFYVDNPLKSSPENPAHVICFDDPSVSTNMGGLTNEPAFRHNRPLTATTPAEAAAAQAAIQDSPVALTAAAVATDSNKTPNSMPKETPAAAAESAAHENPNDPLALQAAEITRLQGRNQELEASEARRKKSDAVAAKDRAVARGAICSKDTALQASWAERCERDPSLIAMLDAIPGHPALQASSRITPSGIAVSRIDGQFSAHGAVRQLSAILSRNAKLPLSAATAPEKGRIALEASAFYRSEIHPHFADIADMPLSEALQAADYTDPLNTNALGTLSGTLVVMRTLELFKYEFPVLQAAFADFSDQPGQYKQTETTRIIVTPAVQTYDPTVGSDGSPNGWTTNTPAKTTDVSITLDEHVGVNIQFGQDTLGATARRLFDEAAPAANYALGKYFVSKITALMTLANFNAYAAVTAAQADGIVRVPVAYPSYAVGVDDFSVAALNKIRGIMTKNEVPTAKRSVLLQADYFSALSNDPRLNLFWAAQRNPEVITDSQLPKLAGFSPFEAPFLPSTGNLVGFAFHKAALAIKTRLPQDYTSALGVMVPGSVTTVTDPSTGISVLLVQYVDLNKARAVWRIEVLLGAAVGDKRGGLCIVSQ